MVKVVIMGLDGFDPELVKQWSDSLPNLTKMQKEGMWGRLESTVPPTTAQVWIGVRCGRNPGFYGFWDSMYRDDFSYGEPKLADSGVVQARVDCLDQILPRWEQVVAMINVPVTYPPPRIPAGYCISGSVPSSNRGFTYPRSLIDEIHKVVGDFIIDASVLEREGKDAAIERIFQMDAQRFALVKHFSGKKKCDCVFAVLRGADIMFRLLCRDSCEQGTARATGSRHANAMREYYAFVDQGIGEVREALADDTVLFIHSGYSTQRVEGRIHINEWLVQNGYLSLAAYPSAPTPINSLKVEWSKTVAWATGRAGRMYLNVRGREAEGMVDPYDYDEVVDELAAGIREIPGNSGLRLNTRVVQRDDICFGPFTKYGPDLFTSFGDYRWEADERVGHGKGNLYSHVTDAGHGAYGYFCLAGTKVPARGEIKGASVLSVLPTVLHIAELPISKTWEKPSILTIAKKGEPAAPKRVEGAIRSRLERLGY